MFRLKNDIRYWWPVTVSQPSNEKPGEFADSTFAVELRYLSVSEHEQLLDEVRTQALRDTAVVERIVSNFRYVEDGSGAGSVVFSPETLQRLVNEPGVAGAIVAAYFASREAAKGR